MKKKKGGNLDTKNQHQKLGKLTRLGKKEERRATRQEQVTRPGGAVEKSEVKNKKKKGRKAQGHIEKNVEVGNKRKQRALRKDGIQDPKMYRSGRI